MEIANKPITKAVNEQKTHAIRKCIFCKGDDAKDQFSFTYDFLTGVRGVDKIFLEDIKWNDATTSTIVKCRQCGCNYIRDVFVADEDKFDCDYATDQLDTKLSLYSELFSFTNINHLHYSKKIIEILLKHLAKKNRKKVSLLDFGSSLSILSLMGRACGFDTVVSYDPKFRPNMSGLISKRHPLDVNMTKNQDDLYKSAPFDAIVCQSAIEHFYDPQSEIRLMYDLLSEGGILFINNPIMPLDSQLKYLKNESDIASKSLLRTIRKSYHIDHLNYITTKQFSEMLKNNSFKEKKKFFYYANLYSSILGFKNIAKLVKAGISYVFNVVGIKYKKVNFFVVK